MEREKSNGCTVHFNSILQLLIYKPQSINKTLIKLEISKEASFFFFLFFFYSFVFRIFLLHLNITRVFRFFLSLYSLNYYSITPPRRLYFFFFYFRSIQHYIFTWLFWNKKKRRKEMRQEEVGKIKNKNNNRVFSEYTPFIPSVTLKTRTALWSILFIIIIKCFE